MMKTSVTLLVLLISTSINALPANSNTYPCADTGNRKVGNTLLSMTNHTQKKTLNDISQYYSVPTGDLVSLTLDEYLQLLANPVGKVDDFEPLTTTSGIDVGIGGKMGKSDIQFVFPYLPNIGEGEVFAYFDFVKTVDGVDFLDRQSNTETSIAGNENDFTKLKIETRQSNGKSYLFASRYVNLREQELDRSGNPEPYQTVRTFSDMNFGSASGKLLFKLPTKIRSISLNKSDIGIDKPFAGGLITLKQIEKDFLIFHFTGKDSRIYDWKIYDAKGNKMALNGASVQNGHYKINSGNTYTIKIFEAETVNKEYPFLIQTNPVKMVSNRSPFYDTASLHALPIYLDKKDKIYLSIKSRVLNDLRESANKSSPTNKLIEAKINSLSEKDKTEIQDLFVTSLNEYAAQINFDANTILLIYNDFANENPKKIEKEYDFRVQYIGDNKYAAEFWEDELEMNSEANAMIYAHELALTKRYSDIKAMTKEVKESRAAFRKAISTGKQDRFTKLMAVLYTNTKDGSIKFHDPFQTIIDYMELHH